MKPIIIAIDGYSSCGKSTLAKALAKKLQYAYMDTGAMYRAVTLYILNNKVSVFDLNDAAINQLIDKINISFSADKRLKEKIINHRDYILSETLGENINFQESLDSENEVVFENMKKTRVKIPRTKHCLTAPHLCYGAVLEQKR